MFGRPQAPPKDWDSLYFYQKVQHLVDHVSDFVVSKCNWWLPAVGLGMGLSILIFGGADGPASAVFMANSTLLPYRPPPSVQVP
ncbi:hypothetical protein AGDE_04234 [Angomonas deanei]|nr:hypothetical protein AGDE_04234 [Angomonas deanei]|eukprot:EPY39694.1 hypothetical protein AGDE_04234 [Angomonas deanei]